MPLVPLMAQVAETHFHTRLWTESCLSNFQTTVGKFASRTIYVNTASGQKYSNTTELTCTKCDIDRVSAKLGSKKVIGIFKYLKYIVLAITFVKIFEI